MGKRAAASVFLVVSVVAALAVTLTPSDLARIDSLGLLRVGPQSAGADPGPAAYGKGEEPAVTQATHPCDPNALSCTCGAIAVTRTSATASKIRYGTSLRKVWSLVWRSRTPPAIRFRRTRST